MGNEGVEGKQMKSVHDEVGHWAEMPLKRCLDGTDSVYQVTWTVRLVVDEALEETEE